MPTHKDCHIYFAQTKDVSLLTPREYYVLYFEVIQILKHKQRFIVTIITESHMYCGQRGDV